MIQNLHSVVQLIESEWRRKRVPLGRHHAELVYLGAGGEKFSRGSGTLVHAGSMNERLGGAANVPMNIVGLVAQAMLFGFRSLSDPQPGIRSRSTLCAVRRQGSSRERACRRAAVKRVASRRQRAPGIALITDYDVNSGSARRQGT